MQSVMAETRRSEVVVEIGGLPIGVRCSDPLFLQLVRERYAGYVTSTKETCFVFDIEFAPPETGSRDEVVQVTYGSNRWLMRRGDFRAEWNPETAQGRIEQANNPYALDSVLRIVHTLLLAKSGGFLLHASSAIRNGRAFLFAGVSGAGKTTIARLAPPDVALLTDEISYVTWGTGRHFALGTPFFGELRRVGENRRAPIEALYLLNKGPEIKIEPVVGAEAVRGLLANILFFARDPELVKMVFDAAIRFVSQVPVRRLTFLPDSRVWELIS